MACALEGERLGAGSAHADNIAPCGLRRLRAGARAESARHRPAAGAGRPDGGRRAPGSRDRDGAGARAARHHRAARATPSGSGRTSARSSTRCTGRDFDLMARSLEDTIAEPRRAPLVPGLAQIKQAAADAGALGCSLSGSGPSLFALCRDAASAAAVAAAMTAAVTAAHRRRAADLRLADRPARRARRLDALHAVRHHAPDARAGAVSFTDGAVRRPRARRRPLRARDDRAVDRRRARAAAAPHADRDRRCARSGRSRAAISIPRRSKRSSSRR